jgi:hypothetical protein
MFHPLCNQLKELCSNQYCIRCCFLVSKTPSNLQLFKVCRTAPQKRMRNRKAVFIFYNRKSLCQFVKHCRIFLAYLEDTLPNRSFSSKGCGVLKSRMPALVSLQFFPVTSGGCRCGVFFSIFYMCFCRLKPPLGVGHS